MIPDKIIATKRIQQSIKVTLKQQSHLYAPDQTELISKQFY